MRERELVVRGTKRATIYDVVLCVAERVEFGNFDLVRATGRRKKCLGGLGEHGFTDARGTAKQDIVVAGDGDGESAFGLVLPDDVVEQNPLMFICLCFFYNTLQRGNMGNLFELEPAFAEIVDGNDGNFV